MRSNSSRVVKLYSRPFCSEPRGGRVVQETENSMPVNCLRTSLTSVLLPEPEGAEMMKRMPAMILSSGQLSVLSSQFLVLSSQFSDELSAISEENQENLLSAR